MKLTNKTSVTLMITVGMKNKEESTISGSLEPNKSIHIPDEDYMIIEIKK